MIISYFLCGNILVLLTLRQIGAKIKKLGLYGYRGGLILAFKQNIVR